MPCKLPEIYSRTCVDITYTALNGDPNSMYLLHQKQVFDLTAPAAVNKCCSWVGEYGCEAELLSLSISTLDMQGCPKYMEVTK
jgi:hypothetical protein